jgi:hypothetical protein
MLGSDEWESVRHMRVAIREGLYSFEDFPKVLLSFINSGDWRKYTDPLGKVHAYKPTELKKFIESEPEAGLGFKYQRLLDLCQHDTDVLDAIDKATQNPTGRPKSVNNINALRPQGTSKAQALRRLRKDAPAIHAKVLKGELSANAGMIEAGFRKKTATIKATPEGVVRYIVSHMTPFERLYIKDHI